MKKIIFFRILSALLIAIMIVATSLVLRIQTVTGTEGIPADAVIFNGHYYKIFTDNRGWTESAKHCEDLGGHLATISSPEENRFLFDYMVSLGLANAYFGFTDEATEGTWQWVTGESVNYTNWHPGEPNKENRNEDYAMFYWKFPEGTWNDGDFGYGKTVRGDLNFICEWENFFGEESVKPIIEPTVEPESPHPIATATISTPTSPTVAPTPTQPLANNTTTVTMDQSAYTANIGQRITISGTFSSSTLGANSSNIQWECSDKSAVEFGQMSVRKMIDGEIISIPVTGLKEGTYTITVSTTNGVSAQTTISISSNAKEHAKILFFDPITEHIAHTNINFTDDLFNRDASVYNHDIARAGMALSAAIYDEAYIKSALSELGFEDIKPFRFDASGLGAGMYEQYFIAHKQIINNDDTYDLIVVVVQGTDSALEWVNNIAGTIPKNEEHSGFGGVREDILSQLYGAYFYDYLNNEHEKKLLITGHSRGGAIANLLGKSLNGDEDLFRKENTFVYTFATPNTATKSIVDSVGVHTNIFNIVNPRDVVTGMPPSGAGYWKYGRTFALQSKDKLNAGGLFDAKTDYSQFIDPLKKELLRIFEGSPIINHGLIFDKAVDYLEFQTFDDSRKLDKMLSENQGGIAHNCAMYIAWLNIMSSIGDYAIEHAANRYIMIECPVDVAVYKDNQLVGRIVDNVIDNCNIGEVSLWVDGDVKYVYLASDEYTIKLTGNDDGLMNFSIYDVDLTTGETLALKAWNDVALYNGKEMLSHINMDFDSAETKLFVTDGDKPISEVMEDGSEISISNGEEVLTLIIAVGAILIVALVVFLAIRRRNTSI